MSDINTQKAIHAFANKLSEKKSSLENFKCMIGFDGFIDRIYRVVKYRKSVDDYVFFNTIDEFAKYIKDSASKSADTEIICQKVKLGGNAPNMAKSIRKLGIQTTCIGALKMSGLRSDFPMPPLDFEAISIADPAYTYAYEFNDGKLMYGNVCSLDKVRWESIKGHVGLNEILRKVDESHLIGIVDWRYLYHMDSILEGLLEEIFPAIESSKLAQKLFFFDIADPSGRSMEDLMKFLKMMMRFSKHVRVILGVNEKETQLVYDCLNKTRKSGKRVREIKETGRFILEQLDISVLVIHTHKSAIGITDEDVTEIDGFYVDKPIMSTGGGDNFNAGFCMANLLNLSMEQSLLVACAVSSFYVGNGYSPDFMELIKYIKRGI